MPFVTDASKSAPWSCTVHVFRCGRETATLMAERFSGRLVAEQAISPDRTELIFAFPQRTALDNFACHQKSQRLEDLYSSGWKGRADMAHRRGQWVLLVDSDEDSPLFFATAEELDSKVGELGALHGGFVYFFTVCGEEDEFQASEAGKKKTVKRRAPA
jgi:hypothetical protein